MVEGLVALVVVLAAASAAGFAMRRRQGRFRPPRAQDRRMFRSEERRPRSDAPRGPEASGRPEASGEETAASSGRPVPSRDVLSAADLGAPLGARATLVQFSTEVCAYCGPTRELLTEVARERDGVAFVEIDAAERMDLTRRLHVLSTPTVLVLDGLGAISSRASGPLRKGDVLTAVGDVVFRGDGDPLYRPAVSQGDPPCPQGRGR